MASLSQAPVIVGFFSYSRDDDRDSKGGLSALRDAIQRELGSQLGRSRGTLQLWQDQAALPYGASWEIQIKTAIGESVFFLPIVTPRAVNSPNCRTEFESFLARERILGRNDLIFPLLYINVPELADEQKCLTHPVLPIIAARHYADWRRFRHRNVGETEVAERIELFCASIVAALNAPTPEIAAPPPVTAPPLARDLANDRPSPHGSDRARSPRAGRARVRTGASDADAAVLTAPGRPLAERSPTPSHGAPADQNTADPAIASEGVTILVSGRFGLKWPVAGTATLTTAGLVFKPAGLSKLIAEKLNSIKEASLDVPLDQIVGVSVDRKPLATVVTVATTSAEYRLNFAHNYNERGPAFAAAIQRAAQLR
jgi:hypothetical protein